MQEYSKKRILGVSYGHYCTHHKGRDNPYGKGYDAQVQQGKKILCQCEYGVSRSAATAAAILEAYYCEGITIFSSFDYKPNKAIYKKLLQALREIPIAPFVVY